MVAEGQFQPDGSFVATNLLAKHDEKYLPPDLAGKIHETKSLSSPYRAIERDAGTIYPQPDKSADCHIVVINAK